jgi:hypothetical protein
VLLSKAYGRSGPDIESMAARRPIRSRERQPPEVATLDNWIVSEEDDNNLTL